MRKMEAPHGLGAAASGTLQATKLEFPEHNTARLRLQRQAIALHQLGPRPLAEFIAEIIARHPDLQERVDAYLRLTPEVLAAVGADRFPPQVFEVRR
jgi:hypothetical protein